MLLRGRRESVETSARYPQRLAENAYRGLLISLSCIQVITRVGFGDSDREERHHTSLHKVEPNYVQGEAIYPHCFPIAFTSLAWCSRDSGASSISPPNVKLLYTVLRLRLCEAIFPRIVISLAHTDKTLSEKCLPSETDQQGEKVCFC
jgi:hypothetical protein